MDPISVIGAIASVAQLAEMTARYCSGAYRYYRDFKEAPAKSKDLREEFSQLSSIIEELVPVLETVKTNNRKVGDIISLKFRQEYEDFLNEFSSRLQVKQKDIKKRLKWPFSTKQNEEYIAKIERYKSTFNLALEKANLEINSTQTVQIENIRNDQTHQQIIKWLSPCDPSTNHNKARKSHEEGTGRWFLESKEFDCWKTGVKRSLWLHGIPGSGKTILCSTIIEEIRSSQSAIECIYFYFDFSDMQKQSVDGFLRSILAQLCFCRQDFATNIQPLFDNCTYGARQPSQDALEGTLLTALKGLRRTYLVIDALDECTERSEMAHLLKKLIQSFTNMNVLLTSRLEQDIKTELQNDIDVIYPIQSAKVKVDIEFYVRKHIETDHKLRCCRRIKEEVSSKLIDGADGMFRWVYCQLNTLRECRNVAHVRRNLKELPPTLDDTYSRILLNINKNYCTQVRDILTMLAFSNFPLRLEEIAEAVAFNVDIKCFDEDERLEPLDIIEICSSLITLVDPQDGDDEHKEKGNYEDTIADDHNVLKKELKFAHYSVKEFLISERTSTNPFHISETSANALIAERCVRYLLFHLNFGEELTRQHLMEYPFLEYAARNWYKHARALETIDGNVHSLIMQLFDPTSNCCFHNWLTIWNPDREWEGVLPRMREHVGQPLYYTALIGFIDIMNELIERGADVNAQGGFHGNALQAASLNGHEPVVRLLLERGAEKKEE